MSPPRGLRKTQPLTKAQDILYDFISVDEKSGNITLLAQVFSREEAKKVKDKHSKDGIKYYILENNSVLEEIE